MRNTSYRYLEGKNREGEFQYPEVIKEEKEECERKLRESCVHISPTLNHFDNQ
jgi:hypothetical protein